MEIKKLKIEYILLKDLKPNEYNPKRMTEKEAKDLEESIVRFGLVDPLIVNNAEGRKNIIIGGHQRYKIYQKLKFDNIPVVYVNIPDIKRERELCLRLSKNTGSWDDDLLVNFDEEELLDIGFTENELRLKSDLMDLDGREFDENIETKNRCPKCGYEW